MRKVRVCIDLEDEQFEALREQAGRERRTVESLVEQMLGGLLRELRQEEREGTDHPIQPC